MDVDKFRNLVLEKLKNDFKQEKILKGGYLEYELDRLLKSRRNIPDNKVDQYAESIIKGAKHIMEYKENEKKNMISKSDTLFVDLILKEIEPVINAIRFELFNSEIVPFRTLEDQEKWIYEMNSIADREKNIEKKIKEFEKIFNGGAFKEEYISFKSSENKVNYISCEYNKKLYLLKKACIKLSKYTRFSESDIATFILTGIKPEFPRYRIKAEKEIFNDLYIPGCKGRTNKWFTIELNASDIRFDEIKQIYDYYRNSLGIKDQKPIKEKSKKLIDFIHELNEIPPEKGPKGTGTKAYWERALILWNEKYPEMKYKHWESIMKAYDKVIEKKGV